MDRAKDKMRRRLGVIMVLAGFHLAVLLVLLRPEAVPMPAQRPALTVVAVAPPAAVAPTPPPSRPVTMDVAAPSFEIAVDPPAPEVAALASASAAPATGCAMTEHIQTELRRNTAVARAAALVPRAARTVASVVTLWSGNWADPRPLGGAAAIDPLRIAVLAAIATAPAACRTEEITGPRLVYVAEAGTAPGAADAVLVLAFGSGRWRWADLAEAAPR